MADDNSDLQKANYTLDPASAVLPDVDWPTMTVVTGNPVVRYLPLSVNRELGIERGLWEITESVIEDTETDEMFVVVSGRATVEFLDEGNRAIELAPGYVGFFKEGSRTRWTTHECLRKVYQIPAG